MSDEPKEKSVALGPYTELAEAYAAAAGTKPHNAYYERPAMLALLPDLKGKKVLDAGCGPGVYAEIMLDRGAEVTGVDVTPKMIELARKRVGDRADFRVADFGQPMPFFKNESFDVVIASLSIHYVQDLMPVFSEFFRLLRRPGVLVFSEGHPMFEFGYFKSENYFATELIGCDWYGFNREKVYVQTYRRPFQATVNPLIEAGFILDRVVEPLPTEDFKKADPEDYAKLMRAPAFICFRARKDNRGSR